MKRIIPILAALCLVVAMAVPAFASETDHYTFYWDGVTDNLPNASLYWLTVYKVSDRVFTPSEMEGATVTWSNGDVLALSTPLSSTDNSRYDCNDGVTCFVTGVAGSYSDGQKKFVLTEDGTYLAFSTHPSIRPGQYITKVDFPAIAVCDGSCPSVDADGDSYCDNCGGFFTPPPPGPLVEAMTQLKEQNQLSQVLTQVVTMIPIGLGCWVGYKGLRKGLDLLRRILHQA